MPRSGFRSLRLRAALLPLALAGCRGSLRLVPSDAPTVLAEQTLAAPDPAEPGSFRVLRLYYGSGTDRRRAEYRDSVSIRTETVDASKLVDLRKTASSRNGYWGFSPKEFPVNGRVWYPDGAGPFPLVLIVHGNHNMKEFSDPGYAYLGELLASRGFIAVSVDENFLNGSIRQENDARAWMLLEHLQAWRGFNETAGGPFEGKVDLDRVGLIGHSRGGEAVAHAAVFNRLPRYPDDANVEFDFGFGIRAVIAIAPVDGQYRPADKLDPDLHDVSYLVVHGSHDGDVSSFMGLRQYQRADFAPSAAGTDAREVPPFKAAVFVYRANHGQWNTVWGAHDNGPRSDRILELRGLIDPEAQRRFGKLYVSAFLEANLHDDARYLPLFRDHRVAGGWLPPTMYITRFQEGTFRALADFEEDVDPTTGSVPGVRTMGDSLATWKESGLILRTGNSPAEGSSLDEWAVTLGWNRQMEGDTARLGEPARYTLTLPDSLAAEWGVGARSSLSFLLGPTREEPGPRKAPRDRTSGAETGRTGKEPESSKGSDAWDAERPPMDLTVEVVDASGEAARLPLSRYGAVRRPLETRILRRSDLEKDRFATPYELVLQSYDIPLADFEAANPRFSGSRLREIRFVFDRTAKGTVVLDDVGIAALDPRFRAATAGGPSR